ncbi:hypothetical protein E2C01_087999 [Portunus trituberculatus]|uniref:Uncharacterized protein n=1 Tax=Portunus trituberculatus TaxID=210409 RepID=A0A5B7JFJ3_PORTR|nr:hypothetical protein [Portunus trituberculatus]
MTESTQIRLLEPREFTIKCIIALTTLSITSRLFIQHAWLLTHISVRLQSSHSISFILLLLSRLSFPPIPAFHPKAHLHTFPSVLESSALCSCGYWSASRRLAAWAHTIKAFMGRLMWARCFRDDFCVMGSIVQSYPADD